MLQTKGWLEDLLREKGEEKLENRQKVAQGGEPEPLHVTVLEAFLQFTTATRTINAFTSDDQPKDGERITVTVYTDPHPVNEARYLPTASTCARELLLPVMPSRELFEQSLIDGGERVPYPPCGALVVNMCEQHKRGGSSFQYE